MQSERISNADCRLVYLMFFIFIILFFVVNSICICCCLLFLIRLGLEICQGTRARAKIALRNRLASIFTKFICCLRASFLCLFLAFSDDHSSVTYDILQDDCCP